MAYTLPRRGGNVRSTSDPFKEFGSDSSSAPRGHKFGMARSIMPSFQHEGQFSLLSPEKRRLMRELERNREVEVPGASMVGVEKAKDIMRHGEVHGRPLTSKQKGLFGLIASGRRPTRMR